MTFPERRLDWPVEPPATASENTQDVIPPTERGKDPQRTDITHGLETDVSRPLTDDERRAAERGTQVAERVYAPASERVPREPVAGHRDVVEHPDTRTPERVAASQGEPEGSTEPSFTRVPRPSTTYPEGDTVYSDTNSYTPPAADQAGLRGKWRPIALGWAVCVGMCAGAGIWWWMRWQHERSKPINRIRRQARHTADELRDRMPSTDEAAAPAIGLSTAMLPVVVWVWQRSRSHGPQSQVRGRAAKAARRGEKAARWTDKAARQAAQAISDMDWDQRLATLKELWHPIRLELEKTSITRR
jgi:hypothetical protein